MAKKTAKKKTAKKATAGKKKAAKKSSTTKKASTKKKAAGKKTANKTAKATAKKTAAKKTTAKKAAKKSSTTKKVAKKTAAKKAPAKKAAAKKAPATTTTAKKKAPARKAAPVAVAEPEEPPAPKLPPLSKRISKKNVDLIRGRLLERRSELLGILHDGDTRSADHSVQAGGDEIDAATYSVAADLSLRMAESESRELKEIELALGKLEDGTYGVCEATGKPIDVRRLLFMPTARLSLEAQEQLEREQLYHDNELGWVRTDF